MSINRDKPDLWKKDILQSVDLYNSWFMEFAPRAFRETRVTTASSVERALVDTSYLRNISVELLKNHPEVLPILRMSTCPPIARDRLVGLAGVTKSLVENMEDADNPRVSPRMAADRLSDELSKIARTINRMADPDIFVWLPEMREPTEQEVQRSATVVADRLCGAVADPIIRNAQEKTLWEKVENGLISQPMMRNFRILILRHWVTFSLLSVDWQLVIMISLFCLKKKLKN